MIPRDIFTEEHEMFRAAARKFMETEVVPFHDEWEAAGVVSRDVWKKAGREGFLCTTLSDEYGGAGADFRYAAIFLEEQARVTASGPGFTTTSCSYRSTARNGSTATSAES